MSVRTKITATALILSTLATLGCSISSFQSAKFTRTDSILKTHVADAPISAVVANGSIEVKPGSTKDVEITATFKSISQERLDQTALVVSRKPDQTLDISVQWPNDKRRNNEGCSLIIAVPDASLVTLKSSNGAISVLSVGTNLDLHTSNGRITAEHIAGSVQGSTTNGRVTLTDIQGPVDVRSSNGRLTLTEVGGSVQARTSNGTVNLELNDQAMGPIKISTSNGSVSIKLGAAFQGDLKLKTSNGRIRTDELTTAESVDVHKSGGLIRFGGSGLSSVETSNGSITIGSTSSGD